MLSKKVFDYTKEGRTVTCYRITNKAANVGKKPAFLYVTGWIDKGAV